MINSYYIILSLNFGKALKWLLMPLRFISAITYDGVRYLLFTSILNKKEFLRKKIVMCVHSLEKGMTLVCPKEWFGEKTIKELMYLVDQFAVNFEFDERCYHAVSTLKSYLGYHLTFGINTKNPIKEILEKWVIKYEEYKFPEGGGFRMTNKNEIFSKISLNKDFFSSRHSIRFFSTDPIPNKSIQDAIEKTKKTPSVCNRQNTRFHVYSDSEQIKNILKCQNGNRGFGHQIKKLILISYEVGGFFGIHERNQGWIDGGMRAMSLIYGLHSLGIGSCCLNCCVSPFGDLRLRKAARIPFSESIVMLLAVGYLPDGDFKVTSSPTLNIDYLIKFH